jgi:hypothetical protein
VINIVDVERQQDALQCSAYIGTSLCYAWVYEQTRNREIELKFKQQLIT